MQIPADAGFPLALYASSCNAGAEASMLAGRSLELALVESYDPADGAWGPASGIRLVIYLLSGDVLFIGIDLDGDGCPEAIMSYVRE